MHASTETTTTLFNLTFWIFYKWFFGKWSSYLYAVFYFRQYDLINGGWGLYGGDRATYGSSNGSSNGRITPEQYWIAVNRRVENIRWKRWSLLVFLHRILHIFIIPFKYLLCVVCDFESGRELIIMDQSLNSSVFERLNMYNRPTVPFSTLLPSHSNSV